ncbi:hypothetical protein KIH39_23445 [Telmatocola sphagniphila]|uniref:N-acetylneuraminate epimerase n=1 Tax=Telmatocola sphagniphila TaxID=1123043 RepID=A0A8E6B5Y8_9BACT|nr:hypothetical protein [Telmatocola sphagniphila]QVL31761.1 hypothetical protein KIH39_23445 [Telmatocola sphagniphila]
MKARYIRLLAALAIACLLPAIGASQEAKSYPPLPEAFSSFGAAVCDGYAYTYGGHLDKTHHYATETTSGKLRRLSLTEPAKGWEDISSGPNLQGLALVAQGGKLYRLGGMRPRNMEGEKADNVSVAACARFDPKTKIWEALPSFPEPRSSFDAAVAGNTIVVVGGWKMNGRDSKSDWCETALLLDLDKSPLKWEAVTQPFKRRALNITAVGSKVYVVCGMNEENEIEKAVDIFEVKSRAWSEGPPVPGPMLNGFAPAVCTCNNRVYVSPADGKIYRLTEKQDGWEEVGSLKVSRYVHRIVPASENLLLVLGGASKASNIALTEVIEPACCAPN